MPLPKYFCWSRFGTEAGQLIEEILRRKEEERVANGGVFYWGIGNALGPSIVELLRRTREPEVLFSPIKSAARTKDGNPSAVAVWTSAETIEGKPYRLPECSLVTSRYDPLSPKKAHYALVCYSKTPLGFVQSKEKIIPAWLTNLLTARPVASSQVTAVVECNTTNIAGKPAYDVSMRLSLTHPYFIRLRNPLLLTMAEFGSDWSSLVQELWRIRRPKNSEPICILSAS